MVTFTGPTVLVDGVLVAARRVDVCVDGSWHSPRVVHSSAPLDYDNFDWVCGRCVRVLCRDPRSAGELRVAAVAGFYWLDPVIIREWPW